MNGHIVLFMNLETYNEKYYENKKLDDLSAWHDIRHKLG